MSIQLSLDEYTSLAFVLARQSLSIAAGDALLAAHCQKALGLIQRQAFE